MPSTNFPNAPNNHGLTPIHYAAHEGLIEVVKLLMPTTSNPNSSCNSGRTPRGLAFHNNHHEIVALFDNIVIPPRLTQFLWQLKHRARRYFALCNSYRINANTTAFLITAAFGIFWLKHPFLGQIFDHKYI